MSIPEPPFEAARTQVVAETARLILRRLTIEDGAFILGLLNEPSFIEFIGDRGVRTLEEAQRYIVENPMASYARFGFGLYLTTLKGDDAPIGICGLLRRNTLADVDIGFAMLPAYWGQGYALESARVVQEHARRDIGLTRIVAIVSPGNRASQALLAKLGFTFENKVKLSPEAPELDLFGCAL